MRAFLILGCLFFIQTTQAVVLYANPTDRLVYFHPAPYLNLSVEQLPGQPTATLTVSMNYGSNAIQREFNSLMSIYSGYDVKIAPAKNLATYFTLDLPTVRVRKDIKLGQTNMGPYFIDKITLTTEEKIRLLGSKESIEASVYKIPLRTTYLAPVEVERYETNPEFCASLDVKQAIDMVFVIGKIAKPEGIKFSQTFESLKNSALQNCFELENSNVNSFADLMQSQVLLKPGGIARGSSFEKKPQEQDFEIQPTVYVSETTEE